MTADLIFWLCIGLAGYTFAGYPVLALGLARARKTDRSHDRLHPSRDEAGDCNPLSRKAGDGQLVEDPLSREAGEGLGDPAPALRERGAFPPVTVVIAARNESARLRARIENLLASDYPAERIDILIVDDGSDDSSCEVVRSLGLRRTRVLRLPQAGGKALALNAAMSKVRTPVTVFADARQRFSPGTIAALVAALAESGVAVVSGEVHTLGADNDGNAVAADGSYARIERALRHAEGQLGWAHAACGAVYAIRTEIFRPLPAGLVLDDVYTPIQALRQGWRIRVEPAAVATDTPSQALHQEFRRKLRTLSGNWQLIALQPWLLSPVANPVWFAWVSHKLLRLLAPWALLGAFLASAFASGALARATFWLQLAAYGIAVATVYAPRLMRHVPLATTAGSFVTLNAAALLSLPMYLRHRDLRQLWRS